MFVNYSASPLCLLFTDDHSTERFIPRYEYFSFFLHGEAQDEFDVLLY
jgi:hypothetical protein